jgi:ferredoxin--NADP+ reductase
VDAGALLEPVDPAAESADALVRVRRPARVTYAGWQSIDHAERRAGESEDRPRVKLCSFEELLTAAQQTNSLA